jgi:hypothetical protein
MNLYVGVGGNKGTPSYARINNYKKLTFIMAVPTGVYAKPNYIKCVCATSKVEKDLLKNTFPGEIVSVKGFGSSELAYVSRDKEKRVYEADRDVKVEMFIVIEEIKFLGVRANLTEQSIDEFLEVYNLTNFLSDEKKERTRVRRSKGNKDLNDDEEEIEESEVEDDG